MSGFAGGAGLMLAAWAIEIAFGYPDWRHRRCRDPVVWRGAFIGELGRTFNRADCSDSRRRGLGVLAAGAAVALATLAGIAVSMLLPATAPGFLAEAAVASSLICSRSLHEHVAAVHDPLAAGRIDAARAAVAKIVGRDTDELSPAEISGAAIESLAESASDGVIAPIFWGILFGLPGIAAYKAINTLDSMIGHLNPRHAAFGGFAARLDDFANLLPARLTGLLFAVAGGKPGAIFGVMWRDAGKHRSPNAGWPESAVAAALGIRLGGPRAYARASADEPWLNAGGRLPEAADIRAALALYRKALLFGLLGMLVLGGAALLKVLP